MKFFFCVIILQQNALNYLSAVLYYMIYYQTFTQLLGLSFNPLFILRSYSFFAELGCSLNNTVRKHSCIELMSFLPHLVMTFGMTTHQNGMLSTITTKRYLITGTASLICMLR